MLRRRVFETIESAKPNDFASRVFDAALIALIVLNLVAIILESFHELHDDYRQAFENFELVSIVVFTAEYFLRLSTADYKYPRLHPALARFRWMVSFAGLCDLLAILPYFAPILIPLDLRVIRMIRVIRLLRVFKLNRYSRSLQIIGHILREKKEELLTTFFISGILMIIAATFMYYLENEAQPDRFPNVIATMWWAVATLTTVGYGDVFPVTTAGKIFAGVISILGIGIIALPTGIVSAAFIEQLKTKSAAPAKFCPHCGEPLP